MKRVLFISAHFPSPNSRYAGHKIAYDILRKYDERAEVDLIVIANRDEVDESCLTSLKNTRLVLFHPLTKVGKLFNILASRRFFPLKVWTRYTRSVSDYIISNSGIYDTIHIEFTHAAAVLPCLTVAKVEHQKLKLVVTCHDILIQAKLRRAGNFSILQCIDSVATFKFEQALFSIATTLQVLCEKDKKLLESLYSVPSNKITIIKPCLSSFTEMVSASRSALTITPKTLLFWGAMNRSENEEAVLAFLKRFGQRLAEGGYTLYVVGNAPSERVKRLASEHVVVTGFVEDPSLYFLLCEIGVVPLLSGAGIKIKTLEMLQSGIPVVSTAVGAEGIDDPHLHIAELDRFMETIERLVSGGEGRD